MLTFKFKDVSYKDDSKNARYEFQSKCSVSERGIFNAFKKEWNKIVDATKFYFGDAQLHVIDERGVNVCDAKVKYNIFSGHVDIEWHYHF